MHPVFFWHVRLNNILLIRYATIVSTLSSMLSPSVSVVIISVYDRYILAFRTFRCQVADERIRKENEAGEIS